MAWTWAALAITCISIGGRLLKAADDYKSTYDDMSSMVSKSGISSNYPSSYQEQADTVVTGAYYASIIFGILILLLGKQHTVEAAVCRPSTGQFVLQVGSSSCPCHSTAVPTSFHAGH